MPERLTTAQRSANMAKIRSTNTKPEMAVRRMLHGAGFRYRLHDQRLPGKPDLVFPSRKKVVFVHGCFWHRHSCPAGQKVPSTNREFWQKKLSLNHERDTRQLDGLAQLGWIGFVVWECELKDPDEVLRALKRFLNSADGDA
ncbi:very short patch repair endonuclease [Arthrobacter sp. TB 23]|uniref:very short patch repair endonuclease n=1 Tax=Arthrobacter sp. TB 23 TaxID=494419 RepID=UPI0002FEE586|nr:very short patch repair endonuclease [Arthrobacter sp. TB 23]